MLHGQTRYGIALRFFREIPENLMRRVGGRLAQRSSGHQPRATGDAAPPVALAAAAGMPWKIGQSVVHPTFGAGVIVSAEGRGVEARVQVNFRKSGLKWLMLEYAKLLPA
jgi:DNA helicase II / ATP-dependent DNA helicase PcrA